MNYHFHYFPKIKVLYYPMLSSCFNSQFCNSTSSYTLLSISVSFPRIFLSSSRFPIRFKTWKVTNNLFHIQVNFHVMTDSDSVLSWDIYIYIGNSQILKKWKKYIETVLQIKVKWLENNLYNWLLPSKLQLKLQTIFSYIAICDPLTMSTYFFEPFSSTAHLQVETYTLATFTHVHIFILENPR